MAPMLTLADIERNPNTITEVVTLPDGLRIILRALRPDDAPLLGAFFIGLPEDTRSRFAPHPFTMEEAEKLCSQINCRQTIRIVGVIDSDGEPRIIAYFIFMPGFGEHEQKRYHERGMPLAPATDCSVAPCLADDFQNRGLGSVLMGKVLLIAKRLGYKRALLIGGVIATNLRAVHFYSKLGFRRVGTFSTGIENYDMIMDL
ncbi:MAG TPA: N-acetyltransferase [Planctomycetota bacterium]|nr:N-acetyltransferase [Planctomycetota bacterium]